MTPTLESGIAAPAALVFGNTDCPAVLHAGERAALTLLILRPQEHTAPLQLRNVAGNSGLPVVLETELFERDILLQPGETYRLTVGVIAPAPGVLQLADIFVEVEGYDLHHLPPRLVPICPSLTRALALTVEPICSYDHGTRISIQINHTGAVPVDDLRLRITPPNHVQAGRAIHRLGTLSPGEALSREVVLMPGPVMLRLDGDIDGHPCDLQHPLEIPASLPRDHRRLFRFLEPRGLADDDIKVYLAEGPGDIPLSPNAGVFHVEGKKHYRVLIRPRHAGVTNVRLREVPEQAHVGPATRTLQGDWECPLFIPANDALTRPARVFYDLETAEGPRVGEIHLAIGPPASKRWIMAATVGAAVTLQSATLLVKGLFSTEQGWGTVLEKFNPFNGLDGLHFFFALSIPLVWLLLCLGDWLQYRWRE